MLEPRNGWPERALTVLTADLNRVGMERSYVGSVCHSVAVHQAQSQGQPEKFFFDAMRAVGFQESRAKFSARD